MFNSKKINKHVSRDLWMIMGTWLMTIGFFLSDNYLFSFLELDDFERKSWAVIALFLTATLCYLYATIQSYRSSKTEKLHNDN